MSSFKDHFSQKLVSPLGKPPADQPRFLSLRTKFSLFVSLVIVLVCSGLSGFLIQKEAKIMKRSLLNTGSILVNTLNKVSLNRLIIHDTNYLEKMLEGALSAPEVVYAIIRDQHGNTLVAKSKGHLTNMAHVQRDSSQPLLPNEIHTNPLFNQSSLSSQSSKPIITVLHSSMSAGQVSLHEKNPKLTGRSQSIFHETIYDFALPVYRQPRQSRTTDLLSSETLTPPSTVSTQPATIVGMIQVGISTAGMQNALNETVWNIGLLTVGIILLGIGLTVLLTNRIITPMQRLATAAHQIATGNIQVSVIPDSQDEIGQLTRSINQMSEGLQQRELSISTYMTTITKQVRQLSTLHQTGAIITSTLEMQKLFSTMLDVLHDNLGFHRMVLILKAGDAQEATIVQVSGIPEEYIPMLQNQSFPIVPGTVDETLLIHGQPVLITDLRKIGDQLNPVIRSVADILGVTSCIGAPLISHQQVLGYLGADKGGMPCTQEDLNLLLTIASHVAVAIDNARAYQDMEHLAQSLEQRIRERTADLQSANERLKELDRLKSAFVSIVSHELRTPMTSIKGLVENMMDGLTGSLNERQSFYLTRVNHNIERLTRMINDLLDLSRIEAGKMELLSSAVNVGSLGREVVELLQPLAKKRDVILRANITDPISLIHADRDKLIQILTNLITNAIKFTDTSGTVSVNIQQRQDGSVHTCVQDTGCGIPLDEQHTIFERFYRGQTSDVKTRGAGLGLAITKSLVELHNGSIEVSSTPGEGSQFCFTVPDQPPTI